MLDTVVLSEMRKRQIDRNVLQWMSDRAGQPLFVSTVTIGEIERGIEAVRFRDPAFTAALADWLEETIGLYGDRILPVDIAIARRCGRLAARLGHPNLDLLIAATALKHGLTVATRNVRHFLPTGVAIEARGVNRRRPSRVRAAKAG